MVKDDYFSSLLKQYMPKIMASIKLEMQMGQSLAVSQAKKQGKKTSLNPLNITKKDYEAFVNRVEMYIKDANRELSKKINDAVLNNIARRGSNQDLARDLKEIFDKDNAEHFNYKNRFENIARTESTNVLNISANNTATKLGAKRKWLLNPMDNKTAEDSKIAERKYGSEDKAIPVSQPFEYYYGGKKRTFMLPPDRPRDRAIVMYEF